MSEAQSDPSTISTAVSKLRLPHPYLTTYYAVPSGNNDSSQSIRIDEATKPPPVRLHNQKITFLPLQRSSADVAESNNSAWARGCRSPHTAISWTEDRISLSEVWLVIYMIFTQKPDEEQFRVILNGSSAAEVSKLLKQSSLAVDIATPSRTVDKSSMAETKELLVLRSTFWQGAASPFGQRSIWIPEGGASAEVSTVDFTMTTKMPESNQVHAWHPRRSAKPEPGSLIYSRYIPALDEHFSMQALDYENPEHLNLFHAWQNDPRVAAGWNETGDLEHHRTYLRNLHEDPHVLTVLAYWDETPFAYFEIYWAAEDHLGAHYPADSFDRGRHVLVGNSNFRGRHRVQAWWSATMHYIFLDDPRTMRVVGEPKYVNTSVLAYDLMHGFGVNKLVDLGHKRSALMICSRERYFQLGIDSTQEGVVGGTRVAIGIPKL